jgi:hypothetical protein
MVTGIKVAFFFSFRGVLFTACIGFLSWYWLAKGDRHFLPLSPMACVIFLCCTDGCRRAALLDVQQRGGLKQAGRLQRSETKSHQGRPTSMNMRIQREALEGLPVRMVLMIQHLK